jgi:hypothetical protein
MLHRAQQAAVAKLLQHFRRLLPHKLHRLELFVRCFF